MKETWEKIRKSPLFLPIVSMVLVLLINLFKDAGFFAIGLNNGIISGRLIDVLNRGSEIAILAVGMTLVVAVSAGTDISVGSVMALAACGCCSLLAGYGVTSVTELKYPMLVGMLFGVLLGAICGGFNGFLVAKMKIQPMVATLILFTAARAIGLLVNANMIVYIRYKPYSYLGNFIPGCPLPTPIFAAIVVIAVVALFLRNTAMGTFIQAVGINSRAARIAGINSTVICWSCYLVCGICAGIAGIVASSRIYSADSANIGLNYEMDAILSVALGGNSLGGGKFNLAGSVIGAYTIQAITTTLLAMGVSTDQAPVVKAIIVVLIVVIQSPIFKEWMAARKAKKVSAGKEITA